MSRPKDVPPARCGIRPTKWQRVAEAASRGKSAAERAAIFVVAYQLEFGKTEMPRQIGPIAERLTALRLGGKTVSGDTGYLTSTKP